MARKTYYQISLRRFFILMTLVAAFIAWVGVRYHESQSEHVAIENLQQAGFYFSKGSTPKFHPIQWPLSSYLDGQPFQQRRHLDLYFDQETIAPQTLNSKPTKKSYSVLESLTLFKRLESLYVSKTSASALKITPADLDPIKNLRGLTNLEIRLPLSGDVSLLANGQFPKLERLAISDVSQLSDDAFKNIASNGSLKTLVIYCDEINETQLAELTVLKRLESLQVWTKQLVISEAAVSQIARLKNLKSLILTAKNVPDLKPLVQMKRLQHLNLAGKLQAKDLTPLSSCTALTRIELSGCQLEDSCVVKLKAVPNLESILADRDCLSKEAYDSLTAAGISVRHDRLRNVVLQSDLIHFDGMDHEVDLEKSGFSISIDRSGELLASVEVVTTGKHAPLDEVFHLTSPQFKIPADWREPSGKVFDEVVDVEYGNFFCGYHVYPTSNRLEFKKVSANSIHVIYRFTTDGGADDYHLDATLPLK